MTASSVVTLFGLLVCASPGLAQSSPQLSRCACSTSFSGSDDKW